MATKAGNRALIDFKEDGALSPIYFNGYKTMKRVIITLGYRMYCHFNRIRRKERYQKKN